MSAESRVLYIMPFCNVLPQTWTLLCCSFPPHPEIKPAWTWLWKKKKCMIHPVSAAQLITAFAWHVDVEMSHHQSVLKTQTWLKICLFVGLFLLFCMKIGQLLYIIPVASLLQFPLCLSDIINSCEFVYSAHLNIPVNKLVSVMLKFVVLHG